ncbi:MAG: ribosome assembly cofactor RimP [Prevotellaceae bacterium]|jgi:ribosome maturation factor RimP|nr:ribosome assembly cofactor RimP [Prevotellaceae bacterium]
MISASDIARVVEQFIGGSDLFLVEVTVSPANEVEVLVDKPAGLNVEECAAISRAVEAAFDREKEDYELTIGSPGLGRPLKVPQQYQKVLGQEVEVALGSGAKLVATLTGAADGKIAVRYVALEAVEGKKRRQPVAHEQELLLDKVKWVKQVF